MKRLVKNEDKTADVEQQNEDKVMKRAIRIVFLLIYFRIRSI